MGDNPDSYEALLRYLDSRTFTYSIDMDANRYRDGVDLRDRFEYERGDLIEELDEINDRDCSVLEMMLALCIRCEEHIMSKPEIGSRVSIWFMDMLKSMDLDDMDDDHFDEEVAEEAVDRMLNRDYGYNGHGGLFTLKNCVYNMRRVEIWYQALWYFNEVLEGERR